MPRYLFAVRHPAYAELEDDMCGMELPDHAAARVELLRNEAEDVRLDGALGVASSVRCDSPSDPSLSYPADAPLPVEHAVSVSL